ncbi:DNA-binding GntR family transcriptional regulator [Rhodococcus sp. LBL1]|uniref:DNA-binding GntR family transcriptional regulator n=1 Tax=Prescottella agglutinans TaxID=1644129 RepID=A0ABT6M4A1_9NOCA|nr:GntR family transcriptional regulator [Prescottella agglutinans]MDH6279137.1 DNA-binding GntR family transcriptional regulator [Prescottella agglutinans]MDH6677995.1 DNA-binding GntR family transcriptional regulator [Rhodococcus sp. LBL1]MDH6683582.1 DNA-binding GntR family transcriptional regulator [Rhodococcus sp. LBL2]
MAPSAAPRSASARTLRRRPQLSDDVAVHVRNLIMSGGVRPGDFIRLDETAADLGVSVTPVREALLTLRGEGLVELVPHRGYVVAPLSREDVADIFWLQGQIAEELAVRAVERIDDEAAAELTELNEQLRRAVDVGDAARIEELEFGFHRYLNRLVGARKLSWFLLGATRYTPVHFYSSDRHWGDDAVASHTRLLAALLARDHAAVAAETRAHFEDGAKRLVRHLESAGIWD